MPSPTSNPMLMAQPSSEIEKASDPINRKPLKYAWSHRHWLHRSLVKVYNFAMGLVPFSIKFGIGKWRRSGRYPYCLIRPGSTVVQIGAPADTLRAGRSRGMYFSLFNGPTGKTVIIEPAETSQRAFEAIARRRGQRDLIFCCNGAWSQRCDLKFYFDPKHPATNFTEGTVEYSEERLAQFQKVVIPCDTVDNMLAKAGVDRVDVLSMTTNGSEVEILEGMQKTLAAGVQYICLALHTHRGDLPALMQKMGYDVHAYDDRGITYKLRTSIRPGGAGEGSGAANTQGQLVG
jgi:FkbM family methyltransferase